MVKIIFIALQVAVFLIGAVIGNFKVFPISFDVAFSGSFVVVSLYFMVREFTKYKKLIFFSLCFCFLGDLANIGVLPGGLALGIIFFSIAHFSFIVAFISLAKSSGGKILNKGFLAAFIFYFLYTGIVWFIFMKDSSDGMMIVAGSLIYSLIVSTMASFAAGLSRIKNGLDITAIGGFFFVLSDSFIAIQDKVILPCWDILIWGTYLIALGGIVYSNMRDGRVYYGSLAIRERGEIK